MSLVSLLFGKNKNQNKDIFIQNRAPIRTIPAYLESVVSQKVIGNHAFLESGKGKAVIFCHGLFGGIFNIEKVSELISKKNRFIMPYLPMYDMPLSNCTIDILGDYLESFIDDLQIEEAVIIGSSMGGGTALYYAIKSNHKIKGLVLCGSSGLSNIPLSKGYFQRKNYDFVKHSTQDIFFDRDIPSDEMITDVFNAIQNYEVVLRSVRFTKAAGKVKMYNELPKIQVPTMLVWGQQDPITPVEIAPEFLKLLPNAELHIIDKCGHVPTQEKPDEFMDYFSKFLIKINY